MPDTARALVQDSLQLVTLPDVYLRVKAVLDDPRSNAADMAAAIQTDPATTARLLRMANSPFFGFAAQVEQVSRAVSLLGTVQVHDLVLATSVASSFAGMRTEALNVGAFWRASVRRAIGAKLLAVRCNLLDGERVFVAGLLSHIGEMVMALQLPDTAERAAVLAGDKSRPLHAVQQELVGFDYAEVGGELLAAWHLPESLVAIVRWHHEPARGDEFPLETAIVHIAEHLAREDDAWDPAAVDAGALELTPLDDGMLEHLRGELERQFTDVHALLFPVRKTG